MDTGTVIGNETRVFVARSFAVFQNRARWSISGGFVMRPTGVCQRRSAMGIVRAVQESSFFRAQTQALCWSVGHTLMGTLVCLVRLVFASEETRRRAERPHALSMAVQQHGTS